MTHPVIRRILSRSWPAASWSARLLNARSEELCVRQNVVQPSKNTFDEGLMWTVAHQGGVGYAATSDLSDEGLLAAFARAQKWAAMSAKHALVKAAPDVGAMRSARISDSSYDDWSLHDKVNMLKAACERLSQSDKIVDCEASLVHAKVDQHFVSSAGAHIEESHAYMLPLLSATAHGNGLTQFRTLNGRGFARQGGFELFKTLSFLDEAHRVREEAIELLFADNCPSGRMDLLLMPDQMMLQIHESIGHPIELDRILGDERNYAGTSFVDLSMFGSYQYGSELLNVSFDPGVEGEFASYAFDDEGLPAQKEMLIEKGILKRPLGGALSQARAKMPGTANARASSWNRAPIDRMANLNLEPGSSSLQDMIAAVENGVLMHSNLSWSIDDSRNKFQFGCEYAKVIKNGRLTHTVRNPNYRGISATFWRNLKMCGDRATFEMYGTPTCGKGEPNQAVRVGHASPACLFADVEVFGGEG